MKWIAPAAVAAVAFSACKPASTSGSGDDTPKEGYTTITPDFPKPMFEGTPVPPGDIPNLEKPGTPRMSFQAPEGTELISKGKPVTSSESAPIIGELEYVTDGEKDGGDGSYVELGPQKQWVQIDLEEEYDIFGIIVWHFHKSANIYFDVVVQVSNDPEFGTSETVYNNDHDNQMGFGEGADNAYVETNHGRIIEVDGKKGRYVRLYSRGNSANELNHYVEVEVYGKK
ncbi:MAG: discoidin domain-containing protein [Verrucomicrobiales bacterium]